jgi:hypothetical protein
MSGKATDALTSQLTAVSAIGDLDPVAIDVGRLAGRVDVLLWAQSELQVELGLLKTTDRFADTRALESFLDRVRDSLVAVQDGSGAWGGLVRTAVDTAETEGTALEGVPSTDMG